MSNQSVKMLALSLLSLIALNSTAFAQGSLPPIKPGVPGNKPGDIIAPMLDEQVAAWCDFNRQIIMTRSNILCVYKGDRAPAPTRSSQLSNRPKKLAKASPKELQPTMYEMNEFGNDPEA